MGRGVIERPKGQGLHEACYRVPALTSDCGWCASFAQPLRRCRRGEGAKRLSGGGPTLEFVKRRNERLSLRTSHFANPFSPIEHHTRQLALGKRRLDTLKMTARVREVYAPLYGMHRRKCQKTLGSEAVHAPMWSITATMSILCVSCISAAWHTTSREL